MSRALPLAVVLALVGPACRSCPPGWVGEPPQEQGWLYAVGCAHEVFVEADAKDLALTRAARGLADALGLDVEARLSVAFLDGRPFVEAVGRGGPRDDLDALELVEVAICARTTYVLVRLPQG